MEVNRRTLVGASGSKHRMLEVSIEPMEVSTTSIEAPTAPAKVINSNGFGGGHRNVHGRSGTKWKKMSFNVGGSNRT